MEIEMFEIIMLEQCIECLYFHNGNLDCPACVLRGGWDQVVQAVCRQFDLRHQ